MAYTGIVVVIPTRNRSAIAMNAVRSVLDQSVQNVNIMISDNSTSEAERKALEAFCSAQRDERLSYKQPPNPLPMAEHWEWALNEALWSYGASHITYLTDRMIFRRGALRDALTAAALYADRVVSYNLDRIVDHVRPIRVEQYEGSGRLLEVDTIVLSKLLSQSSFHPSLPRMLNCIVPVNVLDRIRERYGNIFLSIAPDFRFCFRCLDVEETILFFDQSLLVHYALDRSHGATVSRGEITADVVDFTANLPVASAIRNYATPIPQLNTAVNAAFHEYFLFKQETKSPRFFEVDRDKYLQLNAYEVSQFTDPTRRAETLALLSGNGYETPRLNGDKARSSIPFSTRLRRKLKRVATSPSTTGAWLLLSRVTGITPPGENTFEFDELDEALDYARNISHGNLRLQTTAAQILKAREVPFHGTGKNGNGYLKEMLRTVTPLPLRRLVHERKNQVKLSTLLQTKQRFRSQRSAGIVGDWAQGVNLIAYIRADIGLGSAARGMAAALDAAEIPFNIVPLEHGNDASHTDQSWRHKEVQHSHYDVTVVCINPDNSFYLRTQLPTEILGNRYVIANWFWELPEMPDEWLREFEYIDEVWAPSNFIRDAMVSKATVPVIPVSAVVRLNRNRRFLRTQLGLPKERFLFLTMFDTRSVLERKNPLAVLRAFKRAFASHDSTVGLILKLNYPDYEQPVLRELRAELAGWTNVFVIDRLMNRDEVTSLIDSSNCFVSLHRSEGFGLCPAEAMSLGKPIIITNWSGNTDYMTPDNCIPIDCQLVRLGQDYGPYKASQYWAEPDVEQATHWMKRLVAEPELGKAMGLRGQQTIRTKFSPEAVGRTIKVRLQEIRRQR